MILERATRIGNGIAYLHNGESSTLRTFNNRTSVDVWIWGRVPQEPSSECKKVNLKSQIHLLAPQMMLWQRRELSKIVKTLWKSDG